MAAAVLGFAQGAARQSRAVMEPNGPVIIELSFFAETGLGNFVGCEPCDSRRRYLQILIAGAGLEPATSGI